MFKREKRCILASALRVKFHLGVISSFGVASFRYFAWLFRLLEWRFSSFWLFVAERLNKIVTRKNNNEITKKNATRNKEKTK